MTRNRSFFKHSQHPTVTLEEYIKCLKGSLNPLISRYSLEYSVTIITELIVFAHFLWIFQMPFTQSHKLKS